MSEPPHQVRSEDYDWSQVDLLDACYDPMLPSMDLDSRLDTTEDMPALSPSPSENAQVSPHHMEGPSAKQNNIYKCHICEKVFGIAYSWSVYGWGAYVLNNHAKQTGHLAWACSASGCDQSFLTHRERDAHQRRPHLNGHGRINPDSPNDCAECGMSSRSNAALIRHAEEHLHQPYGCQCGVFFSRRDVLHRHLDSLSRSKPEYPCTYCKRHRGADGFRRKDHLLQHMRNYHHLETEPDSFRVTFPVCSHADCAFYRNEAFAKSENAEDNKPFASQSAYTRHMREEHNESPFPCTISGCNRIGKKGYFREKDLRLHHLKEHPNAPAYRATKG